MCACTLSGPAPLGAQQAMPAWGRVSIYFNTGGVSEKPSAGESPLERQPGQSLVLSEEEAARIENRVQEVAEFRDQPSDPNRGAPAKGGLPPRLFQEDLIRSGPALRTQIETLSGRYSSVPIKQPGAAGAR